MCTLSLSGKRRKKKKAGKCGRVAKREGNIYSRDAPSRYDSYNNRELMPFHPSTASFFSLSSAAAAVDVVVPF